MTDEASGRAGRLRLEVLRGVESAVQRHQEVLAAVSGSENRAEATSAIQSLLGVDEFQASWILSLRWDQVTRDEVRALAENIARQAAFLELESPGADS